ncbi:LLM class flavin-dependent oxidoreductase [Gordonia terrae]|nr:LLM class flavin-dependent oxidoreductase [Gordonia terrae]ANY24372.1 monooxygenase [Gordonia terrae]GAB46748.1 limonene 1,2-monooxygenase [Gordonia terrae NBRC 100016]VTR10803.1 Limonene 1,2-monooxygenase [Clostridioides difficile]VTS58659.1 Limonene 1,2-monooxygenase [Gordonia terrae]
MTTKKKLRFGLFMPPLHRPGLNPDVAFRHNLEIVEHLDNLGYDEVWVGEHHSGGVELIDSPEVFIAAAAERTKFIKLGTGVTSLPYHHPLNVAQRLVQLDYQTRGRVMFGAGPGQLISDASMYGLESTQLRPRMHEALDVILRLLRGETVTEKSDWYTLDQARLHLLPYSDLDVVVTAAITPSGPTLAGKHGVGMVTLSATNPQTVDALEGQWNIAEQSAAAHGNTVSRDKWRLVGIVHLAPTMEDARRDVHYGFDEIFGYLRHIIPAAMPPETPTVDELIDLVNETGLGVIGTAEQAVPAIQRLVDMSGGFGAFLLQGGDFASHDATLRSYRIFAEHVIPKFTGLSDATLDSFQRFVKSETHVQQVQAGLTAAFEQHASNG